MIQTLSRRYQITLTYSEKMFTKWKLFQRSCKQNSNSWKSCMNITKWTDCLNLVLHQILMFMYPMYQMLVLMIWIKHTHSTDLSKVCDAAILRGASFTIFFSFTTGSASLLERMGRGVTSWGYSGTELWNILVFSLHQSWELRSEGKFLWLTRWDNSEQLIIDHRNSWHTTAWNTERETAGAGGV